MAEKLGNWSWYYGSDSDDDEMCACHSRDDAVAQGTRDYPVGESFWIVEARMRVADEKAMGKGERDAAPFAETRNGCFITVGPK